MKIALSPCPNDTYLFHAWITGEVGEELPIEPYYADIQQLNEWALMRRYPLIKISISLYPEIEKDYELLPVGAALGFNCGPKLIAKTPFPPEEISQCRVAIPGLHTTAHFLLNRLLPPPKEKLFCLYHEVAALINAGVVDCGLIIHESRFTFAQAGLHEIVDLGSLWHQQTELPLPLGGLALSRSHPKAPIISILKASLAAAHRSPEKALPFILHHSQEKDPHIVLQHIATYVTDETAQLSPRGQQAIHTLLGGAR